MIYNSSDKDRQRKEVFVQNGDADVLVIEGATYIYNPFTSKAKQNRGRLFELT